jgi:CelD/BcsL family acetyltransferase involved in cellulose biosynthesis
MLQVPGWNLDLRGEVLGRDALPVLLPAWENLCARSVEDNVYYSPRYARALLASVERDTKVVFAVVWDGMRLVALLPFTRPKFAIPLLQPAGWAWQSKYTFSCMPLLDKLRKTEAAAALLDVLASVSPAEWIIPTVNTEGEACRALLAALERRGRPSVLLHHFQRAILDAGSTFDEHMNHHVSSKRRKDLERNRRRLEELGKVGHESHRFGEGLDRAVSAFLKIEASGWKGKQGTALACDEKTRKFAKDVFSGVEANSICRADILTLNGAPIAVSLMTLAGHTGFTVKCSYDEAYRSYSAGLLLEIEVIRSFLSENWASRLDSATAGTHVIDGLWPGRIEVADLIFSLSPRYPALRLSALQISDQTRRNIRAGIKRYAARAFLR